MWSGTQQVQSFKGVLVPEGTRNEPNNQVTMELAGSQSNTNTPCRTAGNQAGVRHHSNLAADDSTEYVHIGNIKVIQRIDCGELRESHYNDL